MDMTLIYYFLLLLIYIVLYIISVLTPKEFSAVRTGADFLQFPRDASESPSIFVPGVIIKNVFLKLTREM